jgi:hypothetical protein
LWILKHATAYQGEAKLMRCEHEATLAKPSEDMLMGCTRAVDLILPLSMVASLRHQSIINKRIDDYMTRSLSPWNSNFSRLFLKLRPVRLAFQPPASSTFLSQQISHQQPASSTLLSEQTSTSHQPPANRTGCKDREFFILLGSCNICILYVIYTNI